MLGLRVLVNPEFQHLSSYMHNKITPEEAAIRAHDITVCLERASVPELEDLSLLGRAVKLALHLRGVPAVRYDLLRDIAVYVLSFPPAAVRPTVELLAEAEFVVLDIQGKTIKTVVPNIPFYQQIFASLANAADITNLSEAEQLSLEILHRLASAPMLRDNAYHIGAEKKLVDRVLDVEAPQTSTSLLLLQPTNTGNNNKSNSRLRSRTTCLRTLK